jgi:peptide/nickel transport system permease protein
VLDQDYVRTARGSGLPERTVVLHHAFKNAAAPVVTIAVLAIPELFLGAVITESIFSLSGMGRLFVDSANLRDYPVLLGILMIAAVLVVLANLLADVLYAWLNPRISYD